MLLTNRRLTKRGAEPWVVIDISLIAVPLGDHRRAHLPRAHPPRVLLRCGHRHLGGLLHLGGRHRDLRRAHRRRDRAFLGCKWTGIRFWTFADALAPGLLLAQAIGRFGNWFNQELFGLPTDLPWGLEIDADNAAFPPGLAPGTLFHPTFLYEVIWNVLGVLFLLWVGRRFRLQWGRLFGLYLVWYSAGRIVWESIRIDPSEIFLGLRTNVWAAILGVVLGLVIFFVQKRRHPGFEPSPYVPGREWTPAGTVQSQDTGDFVDVSEPPTDELTDRHRHKHTRLEVALHRTVDLQLPQFRADVVPS